MYVCDIHASWSRIHNDMLLLFCTLLVFTSEGAIIHCDADAGTNCLLGVILAGWLLLPVAGEEDEDEEDGV